MRVGFTVRIIKEDGTTVSKSRSVKLDWKTAVAAAAVVAATAVLLKR